VARTYKYLDAEGKAAVEAAVAGDDTVTVDEAVAAAWEREHYAHSLLAAEATDADVKTEHADAMKTIEAALKAAGR
jgi:hypothetical protein